MARACTGVCVGVVSGPSPYPILGVVVYGYPESHSDRNLNDALIRDVLTWASEQTIGVVIGGDFNSYVKANHYLACAECLNLCIVSPSSNTTTMDKKGLPAKGEAIDLVIVNSFLKDMCLSSQVHQDIVLADHYPVSFELALPFGADVSVDLPRPRHGLTVKQHVPYPESNSRDFRDWQRDLDWWISASCEVPLADQNSIRVRKRVTSAPSPDLTFSRLTAARGTLVIAEKYGWNMKLARKWRRQERELTDMHSEGPESSPGKLLRLVDKMPQAYLDRLQKRSLALWKRKVVSWTLQQKNAFSFVKNTSLPKVSAVSCRGALCVHPAQVENALLSFWKEVESWSSVQKFESACLVFEDRYSFLLPRVPTSLQLSPSMLQKTARSQKKSSPSFDSWTPEELTENPASLLGTLTCVSKCVPVAKTKDAVCEVSDVRPLDIYSSIWRVISSACVQQLRGWLRTVLHPSQMAQFGVLKACARIAVHSEIALGGVRDIWCLALDLAKMFNSLSGEISVLALEAMGLDRHSSLALLAPFKMVGQAWRLPNNFPPLVTYSGKGLPQGMGTSVVMAEAAIAPLAWRLHWALGPQLALVSYMDDLTLFLRSPSALNRAAQRSLLLTLSLP